MSVSAASVLQLDKETVTLIAGVAAAAASLWGLPLRNRHERLAELRIAQRKSLEPRQQHSLEAHEREAAPTLGNEITDGTDHTPRGAVPVDLRRLRFQWGQRSGMINP